MTPPNPSLVSSGPETLEDVADALEQPPALGRGEREHPPSRRKSETVTVKIGGRECEFIAGFYPDGRLCEVFIDTGQEGSGIRGWATAASKMISHYIQIGGDIETIAESLRHISFEPCGLNTSERETEGVDIPDATSLVDAFAQFLLVYKDGAPE